MSVQTSRTDEQPVGAGQGGPGRQEKAPRALRVLGLVAVCLGVAALAAATFVLSYSAIRAVALQAGITPRLARGYPLLLDAMLVIVLAAVLALRSAGLPSKLLAWLTLLVVLAAAAGADALHAAGQRLPHQAAAITAAVLPWGLVFIAFALLLAMLRHARVRRTVSTTVSDVNSVAQGQWAGADLDGATIPALELPTRQYPAALPHATVPETTVPETTVPETTVPETTGPETTVPETTVPSHTTVQPVLAMPRTASPTGVADTDPAGGDPAGINPARDDYASAEPPAQPELAVDSDLAPDDPSTDDWASEPADGTTPYPAESLPRAVYGDAESAAADAVDTRRPDDPDMPMFHRMFSAPTPPAEV